MNWFSNWKIGRKLGLGYGIIEALMIALGVFSILQISKVDNGTVGIANWSPSIRIAAALKFDASTVRRWELSYFINQDKARRDARRRRRGGWWSIQDRSWRKRLGDLMDGSSNRRAEPPTRVRDASISLDKSYRGSERLE
jgi:Four helix bundle sensory module for signal transduction